MPVLTIPKQDTGKMPVPPRCPQVTGKMPVPPRCPQVTGKMPVPPTPKPGYWQDTSSTYSQARLLARCQFHRFPR
ncbi:hypothetical protein [Moorena producens]|uniref:hypothetical protein n=1 Tax=Moorena producens TaxID=1155739 RepID=UPI0011EA65E7|nr:hypothetical protein [Moorena producens]